MAKFSENRHFSDLINMSCKVRRPIPSLRLGGHDAHRDRVDIHRVYTHRYVNTKD